MLINNTRTFSNSNCQRSISFSKYQVGEARGDALSYEQNYGVKIPGYILAERVGLYFHKHTLYYSLRPIGIGIVIGSCNPGKDPELYTVSLSDHSFLISFCEGAFLHRV